MRLLLDEHMDKAVAEQLRRRGFDVVAVTEDGQLIKSSDDELLERALADRRAIVTYDVGDFRLAIRQRVSSDQRHFGVVFLTRRRFPHGKRRIGLVIDALGNLLQAMPSEDALADREWWLG